MGLPGDRLGEGKGTENPEVLRQSCGMASSVLRDHATVFCVIALSLAR